MRVDKLTARERRRFVQCPTCGAPPGEHCRGTRRPWRASNHMARVRLAEEAREQQRQLNQVRPLDD